jgi:predicted nucleotidyltransferase
MLREKFSDSVRIISVERDKLLARLNVIAGQIRATHPEVVEVRAFGSVARGDQTGTSDVDVMIVLQAGERGDPLERMRTFYNYFDLPVGVDLLVYAQDQVTSRLLAADEFMMRAWKDGLVLSSGNLTDP